MIRPAPTWTIPLAFASGVILWLLTHDTFMLPTRLALAFADSGWPGVGIALDIATRVLPYALVFGGLIGLVVPRVHPANVAAAAVLGPTLAIALDLGALLGSPSDPDAPTPLWAARPESLGVATLTSLTVALAAGASAWALQQVRSARSTTPHP